MEGRQGVQGRARSEALVVTILLGVLIIYLVHRMGVTEQARMHVGQAIKAAVAVENAAVRYREANGKWPESTDDMQLQSHAVAGAAAFDMQFSENQLILQFDDDQGRLAGRTLVFKPRLEPYKQVWSWSCTGGTVDNDYRPKACLPYSL